MSRFSSNTRRSETGAALIIVLAFIVLLAAVMVIFFSQAISYRMQGNNSFNDFKSAALTQSGLETVVGDLQQEIVNGSTVVNYGVSGSPTNVYFPTGNVNAVPQTNCPWAAMPNLVRVSERSDPILAPGVNSRASADSSTNAVAGGQAFGFARWNRHYLLPRATTGATTDTTPVSSFNPPDWVYVTSASGPKVITKTDIAGGISVVGRYAYAIYNEGGLLDANVAGFPSNTATNAVHPANPATYANNSYGAPLPVWGSGLKGSEAFADLTIPAIGFTQAQIDQLVGWRNNYTAQPVSTFNAGTGMFTYSFNSSAAVNYHDAMANATNGFLTTAAGSWTDPTTTKVATDQVFLSRQALIAFINDAGLPPDALQYLATFTRALEQPSYVPPVGRPMVQSSANVNAATFGTGNDAYHVDRATTTPTTNAPSDINPPFLAARVTTSFTRPDGTTAAVGDPLIKERFPLSRLSLFPTNEAAPSTTAAALIYQYFGLKYQVASGTWLYNHDPNNTAGIDRLAVGPNNSAAVTLQGREPDFFELLKAAINVGSLGKGSCYGEDNTSSALEQPNQGQATYASSGSVGNLLQAHDTLTNLQILQIGANIIDQSKADNFPTRIQFSGDTTVPPNVVCGSEDLPYLYRIRNWFDEISSTQVVYFLQPELWDPYSYNPAPGSGLGSSGFVTAANTPKIFRVRLEPDPTAVAVPVNMSIDYPYQTAPAASLTDSWQTSSSFCVNSPNYQSSNTASPNPVPLSFEAGEQNGFWGFREPTLLAGPTLNPATNLNGIPSTASGKAAPLYTDLNTGLKMTGFLMTAPILISVPQSLSYTGTATLSKANIVPNYSTPPNTIQPPCVRMYLDYQDPNNSANWINYDQQVFSYQNGASSYDTSPGHLSLTQNKTYAGMLGYFDWFGWAKTDPRTRRWGAMYSEYMGSLPVVDAANNEFGSERADGGVSFSSHLGPQRTDAGFVGGGAYGKQGRGYQHGYTQENSTRQTYQSDGTAGNSLLRYNLDPDGVPRRNVGGYVTDTSNGGNAPTLHQQIVGLPMAIGGGSVVNTCSDMSASSYTTTAVNPAYGSRPTILHRPFRSVAELGYVFRDTPWGNINFTFPESGDSALLDVFCIDDPSSSTGLVAGRVDLNTRQAQVLAALLSGTLLDKDDSTTPVLSQAMASDLGKQLVARTTAATVTSSTQGPLMSRSDLVGIWMGSTVPATSGATLKTDAGAKTISPDTYYTGFSHDIGTSAVPSVNIAPNVALIPRQRDSVMRALTDAGNVRTWNLLIDLVGQSGRFPPKSAGFSNFVVEGEKHYWLHIAIDRYTGKILDSQMEVVRE
jgi:Tfp pilus assembly protein PilX